MSDRPSCPACQDRGWNLRDGLVDVCPCGAYDPPAWVRKGQPACLASHKHDPDRPRPAHGGRLCRGHKATLTRMIAELPALYESLGHALTAAETRGEVRGGGNQTGLALNERVLDVRDEVHAELVRFVREVSDARRIDRPGDWDLEPLPHDACRPRQLIWHPPESVHTLAVWLLEQVDWLAAQPDADETHDNLDRLTRDCKRLAFPDGRRRFVLPVPCGQPLACDVRTRRVVFCAGRLIAVLTPGDELEMPSEICCEDCEVAIPSVRWFSWAQKRGVA